MAPKNIIVTGASGFIGQHLVKHYFNKNADLCAVVPDPETLDSFKVDYQKLAVVKAGFDEFSKLSTLIPLHEWDIFYYLAWDGYGKATNDYREQVKNIKPLCDAISEASVLGCKRFVFASSFSEYMVKENATLSHNQGAGCNVYGSAKHAARLMGQAVAAQLNIDFISVAFANTFGIGDRSKRSTNLMIHQLLNGQGIDLTQGIHLYDWNYIDDTLAGLVLAGEKGIADAFYYIGSNQRRPLKEIVYEVRGILAPEQEVRLGTYREDFHVDYSSVDVHRLYRDTGYRAKCEFREGVIKTAEWINKLNWD